MEMGIVFTAMFADFLVRETYAVMERISFYKIERVGMYKYMIVDKDTLPTFLASRKTIFMDYFALSMKAIMTQTILNSKGN